MDRRGTSILLLPLIAAFALLYPGSSRNSSTAPQPFYQSLTNNKGEASAREGGWRGVQDVLLAFFEPLKEAQNGHGSPTPGLRPEANDHAEIYALQGVFSSVVRAGPQRDGLRPP